MPNLPTFNVTQAEADKLIAMFGSTDDYLKWLRDQLKEEVIRYRVKLINEKAEKDSEAVFPAVDSEFPDLQNAQQ